MFFLLDLLLDFCLIFLLSVFMDNYSGINRVLIKKHHLDIGDVSFYKNFVVVEIKEGLVFNYETAKELLDLGKMYYGSKTPFVYISNRKNSYSFNPLAHDKTTRMFPNLAGYAVVAYNSINEEIAIMEQSFFDKPKNIFENLNNAISWVDELIVVD